MPSKEFVMADVTQEDQVINAMRIEGGYATFKRLNEILDFSLWATKTPEASVRRIVQNSKSFFRIQPGLWALEEMREEVLKHLKIKLGDKKSEERFSHSYYQGLLLEIGKYQNMITYTPAQDKNRLFLNRKLGDISDLIDLPKFTYDNILRKAKTVDVIWFNERKMPTAFYEVEHTTDIKNSLSKFYELQDFFARFFIVADSCRKAEFMDKLNVSMFAPIHKRVVFLDYNHVVTKHEGLTKANEVAW
jgi:hypothetical protein